MKFVALLAIALAVVTFVEAKEIRRPPPPVKQAPPLTPEEHAARIAELQGEPSPYRWPKIKIKKVEIGKGGLNVKGSIRFSADEALAEPLEPLPYGEPTGKIIIEGGARKGSSTGGKTEAEIRVGGRIEFSGELPVEAVEEVEGEESDAYRWPKIKIKKVEIGKGGLNVKGSIRFNSDLEELEQAEGAEYGKPTGKIIIEGGARKGSSTRGKTEGEIRVGGRIEFNADEQPAAPVNPLESILYGKPTGKIIIEGGARKGSSTRGKTEGEIRIGGRIEFSGELPVEVTEEVEGPDAYRWPRIKIKKIQIGTGGIHVSGSIRFNSDGDILDVVLEPALAKEDTHGKIIIEGGARKGSSTGGRTEGEIRISGKIEFDGELPIELIEEEEPVDGAAYRWPKIKIKRVEVGKGGLHVSGSIRFNSDLEELEHVEGAEYGEPTGKIIIEGGARKGSSTGGRTEGEIRIGGRIEFGGELPVEVVEEVEGEGPDAYRWPKIKIKRVEVGKGGLHVSGSIRFNSDIPELEEQAKPVEQVSAQ